MDNRPVVTQFSDMGKASPEILFFGSFGKMSVTAVYNIDLFCSGLERFFKIFLKKIKYHVLKYKYLQFYGQNRGNSRENSIDRG